MREGECTTAQEELVTTQESAESTCDCPQGRERERTSMAACEAEQEGAHNSRYVCLTARERDQGRTRESTSKELIDLPA